MANTISNAFVKQYSDSVHMNAELAGGVFAGKLREEEITGEAAFFDTLGSIFASTAGAQNSDTNISDIAHDRRLVTPVDLEVASMIDKWDKVKLLSQFESKYVKRQVSALMRQKDIYVISGALGTVMTGKTGATSTVFDFVNQTIPVTTGATSGNAGMNVDKLRAIKAKLWKDGFNPEDPDQTAYVVMAGQQITELLESVEVTSADYNTVRALVNGDVDQFMGMTFIRSELLPFVNTAGTGINFDWSASDVPVDTNTTDVRACFAYVKSAVLCATNPNIEARVSERADKRYNWQAYARLGTATTRMEQTGVVFVPCDQSPA